MSTQPGNRSVPPAQDANAAQVHRHGIHEHFVQHLTDDEQRILHRAPSKVQAAAHTTTTTRPPPHPEEVT